MMKLIALLWLAGAAAAQPSAPDTFVHLTGRRWLTLDPANAFDAVSFIVAGNAYESLLASKGLDDIDAFEPLLAREVPSRQNGLISEDGLSYTFPLRSGVRFHDGSPLTPEDVRYSLLRFMLLDSHGGPSSLLLRPILGVSATRDSFEKPAIDFAQALKTISAGPDSVTITLKRPDMTFLKVLASLPVITSKAWAASHGDWDGTEKGLKAFNGRPVDKTYLHADANGTGPFKIASHDGDQVLFERHEKYWRAPAALRRVRFKVVANSGLRLFMLQSGDADAGHLEDSFRPFAKAVKSLRVLERLPNYDLGDIFFYNFKVAPETREVLGSGEVNALGLASDFFSDQSLRRAVALSFDHERFLRLALAGKGRPPECLCPNQLLKESGAQPPRQDLKAAEALFRKAYGGRLWEQGLTLPVAFSQESLSRQIAAETLKQSLEALNAKFKVSLVPLSSAELYAGIEAKKFPLFISGYYADYPDPHAYALGLLHSGSYFPRFQGFAFPEADALVEAAQTEADPAKRRGLYLKLREISSREAAHFFTYSPEPFRVYRKEVAGMESLQNVNNLNFNGFPYFYAYSKKAL